MSKFVQEDLEVLQAQAKIWLELVLHESLPLDSQLSTVLADGAILSKIANHIQNLRSASTRKEKNGGVTEPQEHGQLSSKRSRGGTGWSKFANVEEFLKVCDEVGVSHLDLFTPTDVVQEKDIKRVCLCLRALAIKAREAQLQVPAFDDHKIHKRLQSTGIIDIAKRDLLEHVALPEKSTSVRIGKVAIPDFIHEAEAQASTPDLKSSSQHFSSKSAKSIANGSNSTPTPSSNEPDKTAPAPDPAPTPTPTSAPAVAAHANPAPAAAPPAASSDRLPASASQSTQRTGPAPQERQKVEEQPSAGKDAEVKAGRSSLGLITLGATAVLGFLLALRIGGRRREKQYEVRKGDTLWSIAREAGEPDWKSLHSRNPDIQNPDLILPNQKLVLSA